MSNDTFSVTEAKHRAENAVIADADTKKAEYQLDRINREELHRLRSITEVKHERQ